MTDILALTTTADIILTLACVTVILDAIEIISERQQYSPNGIYNYAVLKTSYKWMIKGWMAPVLGIVFNYPCYLSLVVLQLVMAILIISHLLTSFSWLFVAIILLIHLLSHLRNHHGLDGSDQMQVILFASLIIFYLSPDPFVKQCCLWFICWQALLSYFTAGCAKARSATWRDGTAISNIMNTTSFGSKGFALVLAQNLLLSKMMCWAVIVFECAFPLLAFAGVRPCLVFIAVGILFHLSTAMYMGLNSFFWSFVATYPAILFFSHTFPLGVPLY